MSKSEPDRYVVVGVILNAIVEPDVLIEAADLLKILLGNLEVEALTIFLELLLVAHTWEHNLLMVNVPVENDLSRRAIVLL